MWDAVWKVLQPQPLRSGMVCTLASPILSANSPKSGEMYVIITEWVCSHMPIPNSRRWSNTSYLYDMNVGCSLKGSTASNSVVVWFAHLHNLGFQPRTLPNLLNVCGGNGVNVHLYMPIPNSWRCSNIPYMYDIYVRCSLKGSTVSTIA